MVIRHFVALALHAVEQSVDSVFFLLHLNSARMIVLNVVIDRRFEPALDFDLLIFLFSLALIFLVQGIARALVEIKI